MHRLALLPLPALFLIACGKVAEYEPNDHFTQATELRPGRTASGTMASASDIDVYRLKIPRGGGILSLHVGGIKSVDFVLSFQDDHRSELKLIKVTLDTKSFKPAFS